MKCPACGFINLPGSDECGSCQSSLTEIPALVAPKKGMERRILEGTVADLSPQRAKSVPPQDSLMMAVEVMRRDKVGCVLVIDGGKLQGVLSERELLLKTSEATDLARTMVREVMRSNPTCLREDDRVADAFHRMALSGHRHVAVQMSAGGYGVISARDLLRYLCR